ncbi:riboflavin transporter FmnP [Scopulibacillus daqui]|uniref:Riboflavin transporter n=2 Tax=Scopulibacillus daqui TaxID=1469162 RepID=A0ABS2PVD2_9BACL|nr:riboflavin transporter FmnP [Scopulibacillus daqui]
MNQTSLKKTVAISLLSAIAVLIQAIAFPLPIFPAFLQMDFSDIPALIGGILLGPAAGVLIEALKNFLHYLILGSLTGVPVGEFSNFIAGSLFIIAGTWFYKKKKNASSLIYGLIFATIFVSVIMTFANYFIIFPSYALFLGFTTDQAIAMSQSINHKIHSLFTLVVFAVLPFNLLKGMVLTIITVPIYSKLKSRLKTFVPAEK